MRLPKFVAAILFSIPLFAPATRAQDRPEGGAHEIQVWTGGGHSTAGGTFEYAVDAVPAFVVFQRTNNTYGVGINPVNLKWNFETRGRVVPYLELGGGTLFTTQNVPPGTSKVNFTSGAAL